jgi:hypothetical protein
MFRSQHLLKPNNIRTCLLTPVLKVISSNLRSCLERIEHGEAIIHHQAHMMDARWVILAVALAAEEDGVPSLTAVPFDFLVLEFRLAGAVHGAGHAQTFGEQIAAGDLTDSP